MHIFVYIPKKIQIKKLLKQHFQDFPLPILSQELENELKSLYEKILEKEETQEAVDCMICKYFKISDLRIMLEPDFLVYIILFLCYYQNLQGVHDLK